MAYSDEVLADSPTAYWRLNEPSGTTLVDHSGNGLDLTYRNSPNLGATGLLLSESDAAVEFVPGSFHYADRDPDALLQGGSAFSCEFWVKKYTDSNRCPVGLRTSTTNRAWWFNLQPSIEFRLSTDGSTPHFVAWATTQAVNTTYHIVGTYDGDIMRLYIDGIERNTNGDPTGAIFTVAGAGAFAIGRLGSQSSDYVDGILDEVAVYQSVLSPTRILAHYNAGIEAAVSRDQTAFRWRNDDGDEDSATWAAAQDAQASVATETVRRLRTLVNATGDPASEALKIQYRKVGDATWKDLVSG